MKKVFLVTALVALCAASLAGCEAKASVKSTQEEPTVKIKTAVDDNSGADVAPEEPDNRNENFTDDNVDEDNGHEGANREHRHGRCHRDGCRSEFVPELFNRVSRGGIIEITLRTPKFIFVAPPPENNDGTDAPEEQNENQTRSSETSAPEKSKRAPRSRMPKRNGVEQDDGDKN